MKALAGLKRTAHFQLGILDVPLFPQAETAGSDNKTNSGIGAGPVGMAMARPKCFKLYPDDILF